MSFSVLHPTVELARKFGRNAQDFSPAGFVRPHPLGQIIAQTTEAVAQSVRVALDVREAPELFFDEIFLFDD